MKARFSQPVNLLSALRWQLLGVVIVASLTSATVMGCGGGAPAAGTTPAQTKEQAVAASAGATPVPTKPPAPTATPTPAVPSTDQLMAGTIKATSAAKTLNIDMDMAMKMNVTGGQKPTTISMAMDGTGAADMANKEMQMDMNIDMDIPEQGRQKMTMQMYIVGGYAYIKMAIPGAGDQWMKMKFTDQIWQQQVQIDQQLALLKTAAKLRVVGTENLGGIQTYVVEITPDMQAMFKLLGQTQVPGMEELDFSKFGALADLFKDVTLKYWISQDKNLLTKVEMRMAGEISSGALGTPTPNFDRMTMDLDMKANYTYDQPVSITLPQEAQGATEVPIGYSH